MAKRKQAEIPGTERYSDGEIDELAIAYYQQRDERMQLQRKEEEARGLLVQKMLEKGLTPDIDKMEEKAVYRFEDDEGEEREVVWTSPKLKVKKARGVPAEAEG